VLREHWIGWKPPTHLQFFSYATLRRLLVETGWEPLSIKSGSGYIGQIKAIAKKIN